PLLAHDWRDQEGRGARRLRAARQFRLGGLRGGRPYGLVRGVAPLEPLARRRGVARPAAAQLGARAAPDDAAARHDPLLWRHARWALWVPNKDSLKAPGCPGAAQAQHEIRFLLAYILRRYDVELLAPVAPLDYRKATMA